MNQSELMRLFFPMVVGYLASWKCKMTKSGVTVKFRPPGYVFGIVWPILYVLLGFSWINSGYKQNKYIDALYFGTSSLLGLWLIVYSCFKSKKGALSVMMLSILSIVFLISIKVMISASGASLLYYCFCFCLLNFIPSFIIFFFEML